MHGDHDVWIVRSHNDADQFTADVANIAGVTTRISVFHRIRDDRYRVPLKPAVPTQLILRVMTEFHARLRAWQEFSPPQARETPILSSRPSILAAAPLAAPS